jgi:hypothetical protein
MNLEHAFAHVPAAITATPQRVFAHRVLWDELRDVDLPDVALKIPAHHTCVAFRTRYVLLACVRSPPKGGIWCAIAPSVFRCEVEQQFRKGMTVLRSHQRKVASKF